MNNRRFWTPLSAGLVLAGVALLAGNLPARADVTADALLKVLVRKGVLTQAEADAVRAEAEAEGAAQGTTQGAAPDVAALQKAQADTDKQVAALKASADKAAKTQVSGYIQARAVLQENGTPANEIFVRRARLTVRHTTAAGRFQMTLDGARNETNVKDAFVAWNALRTKSGPGPLTLQLGQFLRPFGFELERSSTVREFPERPAGWGVLFPGTYDIGAAANWTATPDTTATLALMSGPGAGTSSTPTRDPDNYKDVLARVRHTLREAGKPRAEIALSAYLGRQRVAGTPAITGDRDRYGIAGSVENVAGGAARGEYIRARDLTANLAGGASKATAPAQAWFLLYTHPAGGGVTLGARYDEFDPDTRDDNRIGGDGEVKTLGFVALRDLTENMRLTLAFERPRTTRYNATTEASETRTDDVLTLQGQYKF